MLSESFNLAALAVSKGAPIRQALGALQKSWGVRDLVLRKKKRDEDDERDTSAGNHGIPEIGKQEQAFYDALTEGQKDAYRKLKLLVERLYETNSGWAGVDPWDINTPIDEWKRQAFENLATHPMQTYLVGQMLAADNMDMAMIRPILPTDRQAISFLESYTFNEIDSAFDNMKADLRTALIQGMQQGANPRDVTSVMHETISGYEIDWDLIAVTETARAESQGRLQELADGDIERAIGSSAHDSRTCEDCLRLVNDVVVNVADTVGVSNYGRKRADWVTCIPLHPRCVVEGSEVVTPFGRKRIERIRPGEYVLTHAGRFRRVLATASREHSGIVFEVGGLRVTGDHPVLTPNGFRLTSHLSDLADVLCIGRIAWQEIRPDDTHDSPTERSENRAFGRILRDLSSGPFMPSTAVDFNREANVGDRNINIESVNSELRDDNNVDFDEFVEHRLFEVAHRSSCLIAKRTATQKLDRLRRSSNRIMRGGNLRHALVGAHISPFNELGLGLPSRREAASRKRIHDLRSTVTRPFGHRIHGLTGSVVGKQPFNFLERQLNPTVDTVRVASSLATVHVYDLQVSEDESFIANGIAVHNCRCVWLPYKP